ncbi:Tar ligand binding domain-containing protein [Pectobacterium aquaticum]|uniref:HAMP domain-containing protein n=1 Tax=Pectobacterium aquaticum TaxID=2204145 RepID=A0AA93AL70_9GAMM|nr:Tar ligand binding domain-containing protein [Pectobacterium aquaticum]PLY37648.1 methyl-accepting chemotaxis protein [Pectobacterium carotovorum]MCH5050040.1 Tar ligand binding domain-containing protein [Pectobacterium aquaticum]RRN97551.1 HAMP domain-containing protein [Pectobacterium aquaticum]RRO03890.1 HAMP domain-containing protein [Pectobacterium aquaticum]RRO10249.1 HAMP domain-containing protein [Pectobacterium aquaticum]
MLMPAILRNGVVPIRRRHRLSILSGLLLIIGLFSFLQLVSVGVISQTMTQVRQDISANENLRQQQALMDKARMEVMSASDKLNRAGIYLLVDKETGSEGSWHSLMDEAEVSLKQAQEHYQLLGTVTTAEADTAAFIDLKKSYNQLYSGLVELAEGIKTTNQIDIFFAVPVQAYQSDFTQKYSHYLQDTDALQKQHGQQFLSSLDNAKTIFITVLGLLLAIAITVWIGVSRIIIRPLTHIIAHLKRIAEGDLSHAVNTKTRGTREVEQLNASVIQMQEGLVTLVNQVRQGVDHMVTQVDRVAADNHRLSEQANRQSHELKITTEHIIQLSQHLEQNTQHTQQANLHAEDTSTIAAQGETMMNDVKAAMSDIAGRTREMTEAIGMIENVAFQTHILSLNAAIEAARAGAMGRGFAVVAREVGTLASQSSHSAQNINVLIRDSDNSVTAGTRLVNKLNDSLQNIIQTAKGTGAFLSEISEVSHQQNESIHEVTARLSTLNDTVRENAGQVEASAHTFASLLEQTERLNRSVSLFILPSTEAEVNLMIDQQEMTPRIPAMG